MGCCQSDLKGEQQADLTGDQPTPIKKVATNFSTVDYEASSKQRRDTIVAPDEESRQKSVGLPPVAERHSDANPDQIASADPKPTVESGGDRLGFENKLLNSTPLAQDPTTRNKDGAENKEPYKDVTASPTEPAKTFDFTDSQANPLATDEEKAKVSQ